MVKQNNEIKFIFEIKYMNKNSIDKLFNKFKSLNIRFNENLKPYCADNKIIYEYDDVSQLNKKDLETKINSFFSFTFKYITNTDLYKFLVLKNKDKLTILANIHPLIFDYTSINSFYNIFNNNNFSLKNLITHHHNLDKYLNSNDFKKDSDFWENNLSNSEDYVKFYNICSNNYKNIKIPLNQIKDNKFIFITGIFSLYLSRINQSKGCLLKTSIPKNNHLDINTLLKIEYNEDISFNDFLNQVNDVYDSAIQHSMVNIENYTDYACFYSVYDFTDLKNVEVVNGEGSALTLNIYEDYLELIYNADLFSNSYMEHMAANIKSLISSTSELPNIMCKDIDILSDNEKKTISEFSKGKTIPFDKNTSFGKVFQSNAKKLADKLAIDDGVNQISYQELDSSSNSIANDLKENYGIGLDSIVALMLPRDYRFPELVLALNKIGAIFIPIDPSYPIKRIEHMLNIGKADFIITTEELLDESPFDVDIIYYGDLNLEDDCEFDLVQGSDFAILFTSGTTGLPKGVAHSNKQLIGTAVAFNNIFDSFDCDLIGCYASFSFILSFRIFWALYDGKSCRIFNDDERRDSLKLIEILKDNHFHDIILPPSLGIPILENENINLDYMVCCGSKLNALPESNDFTKIVNAYGMTEIMATANICNTAKKDNSIGKSMANTWTYILDKNNNLLPVGVPGEICISCDYLTPGYINSPELTKKVIVNNPYSDCEYNKLLYRTGDIGFYNFEGKIEIIGRKDDQLSVRGFRIESEEILKILERFENLKEIYLDTDNDNLIAYYTTFGDLSIDDVKFALEDELPQYMVPSVFIKLDKIPLNANGKIDKFELKKNIPELAEVEIDDGILSIVVDAFRDVLNCESVLIDDNFVGLGGNSLSAMNLQLILNNHLGINLSSNELIELATPLKIANHIKFNLNSYSSLDVNYTFNDGCPLSESQLNLYLDEQVKKMDLIYNNPFKIKFNQNYSENEIRSAIYKLFDLYPVLKAHVVNDGGDLSFIFDSEPEIKNGFINDLDSFVRPFNLGESLSRFLIIESESILCIDCHHLIFDGTSIKVLVNSLLSILNNNAENIVDDGVLRQISYEESITLEYLDDARDFFDEMLAERDEVNDLLDSVNGDGENAYTDYFKMDLSSFLKDNSITYNQFFASVFAYTLSRFTGSDKIMFNLIEDGRGHVNLSDSVGMFVKTLPVLIDCENQDIESFIKYSSGLINSVMKYDLYSFRILVNDYDLNSDISFQYNHDLFNISGLEIEELEHDVFNDFNFLIQNNSNNNFEIKVQYSSKYSNEFIKRFVDSYKLILEGMLSHNKLNEINYIGSSDLTILDNYNQTEHDLFYNDIMDAFNDNLVKYPDNALVSYNNISYSYAEGAFIADKIRKLLIDFGVEPGDCVSFLVPRSELYMFCILGILSAGAIYVPLDDKLPNNRLSFILEDSDSHVVIASDETYDRVNSLCEDIILNISDLFNDDIGCLNHLPVVYGDLACILYTSGTTGVPKGVKITRKSIVNYVSYYVDKSNMNSSDVYALFASIGFDVGAIKSIFVPLYCGACLDIIPEEIRPNINELNRHFINVGVTHTHLPTQVAKLFIKEIDDVPLEILVTGGEKLGEVDYSGNYLFIDSYGPTEACVSVTAIEEKDKIDSSSIGYLFYNTKAYVLDDELRHVPIGAVGELFLAGNQIADGYLNRDKETHEAFIVNPFENDEKYKIMYRTGDMVRFLPDGTLAIVGRRDSQVKIRGNRVELSEIEAVIHELDYVENVTVQTVKNNSNNELVAYVVSNNNDKENIEEDIKAFVLDCKPDYMVPSYVVLLNSIPLTVNGKVDKGALPEVNFSSLVVEYVAPSNETEKQIVDAFEKVFNQNIGIYDDFIHLGGDSLTAIKLLTYIDSFNISAGDILSLRTPYAIANRIRDISFDLDIYSLDQGCPLNEPQLNVYLDIKANDKEGAYLIPLFMNISGEYSVDDIGTALGVMFDVHPILGMCVSDDFDVPYLIKGSEPSIIVESDVNNDFITQFLTKPFDLHDSLCRFLIVEEESSFVLYAVFHHIIFDAISSDVFKRDLYTILGGRVVGVDDSFLKASAFNQQIAESNEYTQAEVFYESMLADIDDTVELLDSVLADGPGSTSIDLNMNNELFNSFLEKHNISENVLFSSVFAYTLSRFVGSEKILFNIVENGRDRFNNFDSVGMFVNTLPLLVDCKNQNVNSFMEYVSNIVYGVMRYNYYPFRLLANKYDIKSNIIFQFLPEWVRDNNDSDDTIWDIDENDLLDNMGDLIADLSVEIIQRGNNYHLSVVYSDKYSSDFINRFVQSYNAILNDMLCVKALSDISYVSSNDLVLLDEFNNTEHDFPYDDVLDAFNTNLVKNPDKDLVTYMNRSYSYGEGAFIADKIAKSLTDLGVESGNCVGFLVPRSELYIFSVLGILSVGSVFVPLDDGLPNERLSYILGDSDCKVVIVSDETYNRADEISDCVLLNISNIINEDIGSLEYLPVVYGDLACILYTSGTTGVPKGVKNTRKSLINVSENYIEMHSLDENDVYGLYSAIGFDMSTFVIDVVITAGACLAVIPDEIKLDMLKLNDYFIDHNVSHAAIPTPVAKLFMKSVDDTSLDVLHIGGEKLGDFVCSEAYRVIDSYGPTESFAYVCSIDNSDKVDPSSVGFVNFNVKSYILDNDLRRVPVGAVGELYFGGYQLARGYLNRDEETNHAFVDNPYEDDEGFNRLYRTGDMGRFLPDGSIDIIGRRDTQVKIRGNRVELSEVESVIRNIDIVEDVTVQTLDNDGIRELIAYVVLSTDLDNIELLNSVCNYVAEHKPNYMVPSYVVKLDHIPLNVNGKVDKSALPNVDVASLSVEYVAPSNETEKAIVDAFEKAFSRENISIYDDFVRLGGDSLTAIKLLTYLDGFNISAGDVLGLRTPYAIAGSVRNISFDLDVYSLDSGCPLNEPQLNVYLDIRANDKKDAYLIPLFMNIPAEYSIEDIKSALNVMFDAHPVLCMCVSDDFDVPYLIKGSMPSIIVESNVNDDFITEFLTKPFDLYDSLSRFLIVEEEDSFVLYAVFHHIIFDAISNDVFKRDLFTVLDGGVVDLDDSFLRASAFNQQIAESNDNAKAEEFYESMLADIDDTGELLDSVLADGPGSSSINLDIDYDLLDSFLEKHNVSLNILFSSVFAYTLSRFVGSEKVSFNIVENGRDRLGNYDSLGMFVNTLPLLIDCKNQDIGSFVEYVSDLVYGVMRHNYYPFRLLAKKYDIKSDVLFQFLPDWVMDNDNSDVNIIKSVRENIDSDDGDLLDDMSDLIADLSAGIIQKGNDYLLSVVYSDKYSGAFIDRFVESYKFILNDILNFEELSDISYVSCDDLALLDAYNDTAHVLDYVDVLDAFNDNLIKYPNNILIKCEDKSYTYGESAFIINEIASMLNGCGVSRQDPVILFVPRSEWFLFASMAVLSCCCAYVPIDENYPDNYIKFMIEKCNSKTIITTDAFQKRVDDIIGDIAGDFDVINVSCLENSAGSLLKLDYVDPSFDDVACIHFTSGTTGTPKGVLATRLGIYNMVEFYVDVAGFGRDDVHGVFSSLGFDVTLAMYSSIVVGGATTIVPSEVRLNIDELNKFFIRHGVTHSIISTPVAKLFCENVRDTSIKHIQAIGEKLGHIVPPKEYVLSDVYGPTETVLSITSTDVVDKIDDSSVGFINYNTKGYILDKNQNRVPCGAVGELYISGYQVSKGYINNPDESEKAFFANPFDGDIKGYERMYNTGDVVRLLPDGSIGFINRQDNQVKIRGNRVELLDIESVIREIDYVDDVTVQTVKNNGNNELAAYVVLSSDLENIELLDRVQDYVRDQKPDYMVPSYVVELDKIPLTVNGKVDKSALPKVDLNALHTEYVAPVNENEKIIVNAFEKVFNQDKIGIYDDFIRLGGDSLTAIRLLSYIEDFNINVADILSLKTPKLIAENLNKFPIDWNIYSLDEGCPLNESQLNVYLDIKANDKTNVYLIPLIMNISGRYKIDAIISALESMLNVHPILGMSVSDKEDVPYLVKGSKPLFDVVSEEVDDEFIVEFLSKPFDLSESLCRFLIVENSEDYNLFAVFHHIIFDGLSKAIFKQDLQHILEGKVVDLDDSFLKVSAFNQQITESSDYAEAEEFYESMLADADDAGELLDSVLADGPGSTLIDLDIDNELFNSFLEKHNVSENVFFSSVFAYTLSRFVGSDNVLFNIVENGRDRFNNFDSVGMFVNTLPLLVNCKNQDIDSFMEHVSRMVYGVMRYNYYPFRLLANKYDIKSDIIFQFLTDWVIDTNDFDDTIRDDDEDDLLAGMSDLNTDLNVEIIQKGNNYLLSVVYCDKYSGVFIDRFVESYKFILNDMLNVKGLSDISYISCDDLVLLDEFNDTDHTFEYCDVLDAFNDNLEKYEDNFLVGYENKSFTFGESAFIANEIANGLNVLGVARQDFVALFVERSEWFLLASVGVLSMGGIYVPIDTDYPDERIVLMLKDTKSKVVIVSNKSEDCMREIILDNGLDINILNVDSLNGEISSLNHLDNVSVDVDDVACVLYTSGTTGAPKGVLVSRQAINNFVLWYVNETNFTSDDVYGMHCSYVFDMHVHALYSPIVSGGSLYVVPEDIRLDLKALNDYFVEHNCTHTYITSQVGKLFAESGMETTIKLLCFGGMKLGELNAPDSIGPFESYGPSENLAISTSIFANRRIDNSSIGHFVSNVKGYVLDSERRRVPLGAVGELYLSGAQLTKGYLNREDENSKVFFDNSFDDDVGYDRIYKTGDMVRFLPDGSLGIVGRRDGQVKIRGNRVELDEVESVIRSISFVEDVTVQTADNDGNNELVAYVVYDDGFEGNLREFVCDYVANRKPDYMIPSYVVELDEVPLTVNGKVDKHALPNVDFDVLRAEYVAPTNETEKHIVNIFESVFNQKNIGLYDDFVQLGGDSISAIRVSSLLEKNSIHCSARDILNYKKPYLIAQHVNENIETIHYDTMEGIVDLLPIQSYFFDQVNLNNYAQEFVLKFNVDCDRDILQKSFNELCNIHDMLRAHYKIINNNIKQEILPINSTVCNIKEYNINDDLEENMRDIFVKSTQSLDIENKLLDVNLVHYDDEDYLLIVIHHLIIDGVSWHILLSDLTNIYYKLLKNERIDIVKPYPYKMWVDNVKNLVDNISDDEKQHWLSVNALLDDSLIMGPTNIFSFNVDIDFDADNLLMLSEDEYLALAISRAYKKTYNRDIIFNRESYGRDDSVANLNRTVGWFTSQYPVPVKVYNGYDDLSLISDVYSLKRAFKDVNNLGLNYASLIYTTKELEFKHCPVTFNFLSSEFVFKNELFESINYYLSEDDNGHGEISSDVLDSESYGITFNVSRVGDSYVINGDYAQNTYLSDKFSVFLDNIKEELRFIANYKFDNIVCCLSEPQLGVYLDEKVHDKDTAYSTAGIFECNQVYSVDELKDAIHALIEKHPILKGRVLDTGDLPLLICDSYPEISITNVDDYSNLTRPFDLGKSLARFFIVDNKYGMFIVYDMHHIISDATSRVIINRDLGLALSGELDGKVDLGFVYASRDSFDSQFKPDYDAAYGFFREMFADIDEVSSLLNDVDGYAGSVSLPIRGVREDILSFVHDKGITVSSFLNAVFAYAYSRFIGGDKVYYTFTVNGRHEDYSQDALGMFVRTIPILVDCTNASVGDFLSGVSNLILESMGNSVYPFRLLASEFGLSNSITFEYNYDLNDTTGVGDEIVFSDRADCVSDLLCFVNDLDDGFLVSLNHVDIISQDTAERFVNVFKEILVQLLDKETLSDIDYISNDDVELLDSFNDTGHDLDYADVLDAFNDNLSKYPGNTLVSCGDCSYTYAEGAFIADKIASCLRGLGVVEQDKVAFLVERSELYMFCVLGILSCGGVYVPLDDKLPDERIRFILEDTDCGVVIVSDETYDHAVGLVDDNNLVLLNISDIVNGEIGCLSNLSVRYGDLACILYTSGTTGVPKGVKITRKSIINMCENYVCKYGLDSDDVFGLFSTIGFDMSSFVISVVLCAGACLIVVPEDIRLDMSELNEYFINHDVSHTYMTTQVAKLFMDSIDETSLDVLVTGGEKLGEFSSPESYSLIDSYGPTESFGFVDSMDNLDKLDYSSDGFVNFNVKFYVLDDELRRVPVGAVGELYIAGYQLADGYLNLDVETSDVFIDNPYDDTEGFNRLYRTGDLVRFLPDGSVAIVGRRDSQVKIRGNRVELGEVESVIRSIDFVEDVTVQTVDNNGNNELVAYVVVSDDEFEDNLRELVCDYVTKHKPDYMVPSYVVRLDEVPLTVNGKVDKNALPEVDFDSLVVEYVAPRTNDERLIVDAFEKVFNQRNIGVYDDFVRLGGDSLTAIKLLSYLDGFNISAGDVLSLRTPYAIANNVGNISFDLDLYSLDEGCPLNEPQLNVYLDIKANEKNDTYLIPLIMDISGEYGVEDIRSALGVMFDAHPILGMCVSDDYDVPYLIKGSKPLIIAKSGVSDEFITKFLTEPFDLHDSLCRFLIVEEDDGFVIYAVFHHIIFDAISDDVFKRDLLSILDGCGVDLDDSFLMASAFNQQIAESIDYVKAEKFYESMLADVDDTGELLDCVLADGPGSTLIDLDIDNNLLKSFLEKHNVNLNVLFSGVFAYTLSRFVGCEKVLFNIVENGRDRYGNYNSIGMFVNTLPLLVDCKNQDISAFMKYVSSRVYSVMRYNYYPFRLLANNYDIKSDIIFQFLPEWVRGTNNDSDENIINTDANEILNNMADLIADLTVEIIQRGNEYLLSVVYSDKYSSGFINRFVESYKFILNDILNVDELSDISYVSSDDLVLLDEFNDNRHDLLYNNVLDAFNANLVKYPDNILVSYEDKTYSYGEGAFIADKIAKSLIDLDMESGDCIGFLVPRSELYMFSVLGISSCGAVFVPLDDDLPDDRLSFMLCDSDCKAVIVSDDTQERLSNFEYDGSVLNISDIVNCDVGSLSNLTVTYGDLACILYTSGTTGIPKGVKVTHISLINVCENYIRNYNLDSDDVYGLFSAIGFDMSSFVISVVMCSGASLDVVPEDIRLDMLKLNEYFINHNVTQTFITTQVGKLFVENVNKTSLDLLLVAGESLGDFNSPENYRVVDAYGPTESFAFVSSIDCVKKLNCSSMGFANFNIRFYVLDDELRQVPVGAVGELYIAGYQLARGYLNRDDETSRAFIDNPYDDTEGFNRLYRTGDMVRFLPDGSLGIVGRRDGQVKIRGNRVELGEVESVIRSIDFVEDVTVQTVDNNGNNELVAYVVVSDDVSEGNLREIVCDYVASREPDYMVPSYVVELDKIPLTVNGKVDNGALPDVDLESLIVEYVAPTNETEKAIVDAFETVFNQKGIGLNDDFIRLGGDSIRAIRLISLLEKNSISCSARDILKAKTPYNIAKMICSDEKEYGFVLAREGTTNQNMFLLPPAGGLALTYNKLIKDMNFEGNVYIIDDYQYELSVNEIRQVDGQSIAFEKYWDAIKDIFQDGDILVGYSIGCLHVSLLCERLEKIKKVEKCVLIDGTLKFVNDKPLTDEDISSEIKHVKENYLNGINDVEFEEKMIEVFISNLRWKLPKPKVNSHVIYLSTVNKYKEELDEMASDYEFININSTHDDIIDKDVDKIFKYLN